MTIVSAYLPIFVIGILFADATSGQTIEESGLARMLADWQTRESAVAKVVAMGDRVTPLLLSWTRQPPTGIFEPGLYLALAQAFGRMKTKEAIPWLITRISLERAVPNPVWERSPEVIEQAYPAAQALIRLGPVAAKAVIQAYDDIKLPVDRALAVFVVARVATFPEAKQFLERAEWEGSTIHRFAREALQKGRRQ